VCLVSELQIVAVMVGELGRQLAALRRAAGLTQHQLAPLTSFSRTTVSLAEIGRESHARQFWEACDKALDTGGALTAGFDQITTVREAQQQATARAAQQAREAHALAALTAAQHHGDIATKVTTTQPCPQCQHPVTVLTTLIPSPPSPSRPT
jgi:transcriptional regulator with XRE-family HTH domain